MGSQSTVSERIRTAVGAHVYATTALLSLGSLALVFGAALGAIPASALPHAPAAIVSAIPHVNAALSAVALVTIGRGWRAIRRGDVQRHRRSMLASFALFLTFLALYLYRIVLEGPTAFPGPEAIYQYVYLPLLAIHILLAIVCVPLLYFVLILAGTRPIHELPQTPHPRVGRVAASLWAVSFALGIVVYALLYVVY